MTAVVSVDGVDKQLAGQPVLHDVAFEVAAGTVCALVGPNGAGKTTLLSLLVGLRRPDRGTIRMAGTDPASRAARSRIALVQQEILFPPTLWVNEIVRYVAGSRRYAGRGLRADGALDAMGLGTVALKQVGGLSGGQRRRLAVLLGLVNAPEILVLDEATANLDTRGRADTWALIERYTAAGGTVVATSHLVSEVDDHADVVIVLRGGFVVLRGDVNEASVRESIEAILGQGA